MGTAASRIEDRAIVSVRSAAPRLRREQAANCIMARITGSISRVSDPIMMTWTAQNTVPARTRASPLAIDRGPSKLSR